jgi:hypothetical protein
MSRLKEKEIPVQPGAAKRHFSPVEANRALVLVRKIVADVVGQYGRMIDLQEEVETVQGSGAYDRSESIQRELVDAARRLQGYATELDDVGVELKDWSLGVVDFPCLIDGREAYLCWRHGEARVEYWHEMCQDPSNRQPIGEIFSENSISGTPVRA